MAFLGLSAGGYFDAEGCADADFRRFDVDTSAVIFFDDAFCKRQSEAPAATLGGKARVEHVLEVFARDAFAGVGDFDDYVRTAPEYIQVYATGSCHGVDGFFAEVLDDPFKKRVKNGAKRGRAKSIVSIFLTYGSKWFLSERKPPIVFPQNSLDI